ncbi:MAG: sulfatase-like hydrolase/transferase [Clostridia bacterium]|nr:sulfatase-like hydrolase/transferase [Clostridia bacterium]
MKKNINTPAEQGASGTIKARLAALGRKLFDFDRVHAHLLMALILTLVIECLSRRSFIGGFAFIIENPIAFAVNYLIALVLLLPTLLIPKRIASVALVSTLLFALGVIQFFVLINRVTPLSAVDFSIFFSIITIIDVYFKPYELALMILAILAAIAGIVLLFIKTKSHGIKLKSFLISFFSATAALVVAIVVGFQTNHLTTRFPNLADAYNDYGFAYCFSLSVFDRGVNRPNDYSEDEMTEILDQIYGESEGEDSDDEQKKPNVVFVQLESFFDVKYINELTYSEDPVPNFTALKEQYPSGFLTVPVIGAATINVEFEVLTGMRIRDFGAGEYPYRTILSENTCETIAYDLLASGYRTHAIHNNEGTFYQRNEVYKNLGFESFTSIEYFPNPTYNPYGWAEDAMLTDEILHLLSSSEESDFVFTVAVQSHGDYPDDYVAVEGDVTVTGGASNAATLSRYNYYVSQLHAVDEFVKAIYNEVMALDEDTILVLYGDHLPTLVKDSGITLSEMNDFQTEYIIIPNFEVESETLTDKDIYAYQLFPRVMDIIGNDEGVINMFHRVCSEDEDYADKLTKIEYDVLYGEKYAYGDTTYDSIDYMTMGSRDISITDVYVEGDYVYVKGENFTPYSVIFCDDDERDTEYLDSNTLRIPKKTTFFDFAKTDKVEVYQVTVKGEPMSKTEEFIVSGNGK